MPEYPHERRMSAPGARTWRIAVFASIAVAVAALIWLVSSGKLGQLAKPKTAVAALSAPVDLEAADLWVLRSESLTRTLDISGGLKAVHSAVVKAKLAAELKTLSAREGDVVKAGQVLGRLDSSEFDLKLRQAEQTAAAAQAQLDIARRTLTNNSALVAQGFISPTALEASASGEATALANHQAALAAAGLARKALTDTVLVAPISGLVSKRLVEPGERLPTDARIIEIVDLSSMELEAAVTSQDITSMRTGQSARLVVDGLAAPVDATVARINPSTEAGTRSVMAYLAVKPQPGLRQGLFAQGRIELERTQALAVPLTVVRLGQALPYVLAVVDGKVTQQPVTLGARGEMLVDGVPTQAVVLSNGVTEGTPLLRLSAGPVRDGTSATIKTTASR